MQLLPALFGLGCMATIAFAAAADDDETIPAALLLTMGWAASNISWEMDALRYLPLLDLALTAAFFSAWRIGRQGWLLVMWILGVVQLAAHIVYAINGLACYYVYALTLNATFAAQLATASSPGGRNGFGDGARWLRRVRAFRILGNDPSSRMDA